MGQIAIQLLTSLALAGTAAAAARPNLPRFFVAREGTGPDAVQFQAGGAGLGASLSAHAAVFRFRDNSLRIAFLGATPSPGIEGGEALPGTANFLEDAAETGQGRRLYGQVIYRQPYPGIDVTYDVYGTQFKSAYRVAAGADPGAIRLRYETDGAAYVDCEGALHIPAAGGEWVESPPEVFQDLGGHRVDVLGRYLLFPDGSIGFEVGAYDRSRPLVIDPVLSFSTLFGGQGQDSVTAAAVDAAGNVYVAGYTDSTNLPTANPAQNFRAGSVDAFVAKFDGATGALVYSTYIGGSGDDRAYGIAVDVTGAAYVAGSTASANFPVRNAYQPKLNGRRNAFVVKLSPAGNSLVYSTYLGGASSDSGYAVAVNAAGNAFVAGDSTSLNFPTTVLQRTNRGGQDAFIAKLAADGKSLAYSTLLGGDGDEHAAGLAVDSAGAAYVTGSTLSTNFPTAPPFRAAGGGQDVFVTKLNAAGAALVYSTYYGGSGGTVGLPESGQAIVVDAGGAAYVAGITSSSNFPVLFALQPGLRGMTDGFVLKLGAAGTVMYSTYVGGSGWEMASAIAVDGAGSVFVAGQTTSPDLAAVNATQAVPAGDYDAFWGQLTAAGDAFTTLGYFGGAAADSAQGLVLDNRGSLYLVGQTLSSNLPLKSAYQSLNAGSFGGFVAKMLLISAPLVGAATPASGQGSSGVFTFTVSDGSGYTEIDSVQLNLNATNVVANSCWLRYSRATGQVWLGNDSGGAWLGPVVPGAAATLQNSQCTFQAAGSSVTANLNTLTLNLSFSFAGAFNGAKSLWAQAYDSHSLSSGWVQIGTWTVPAQNVAPTAVSVTPSTGSGMARTFQFAVADGNGYADINNVQLLFNSSLTVSGGCWLYIARASNQVWLSDDTSSAWLGPVTLGASGTLQNSRCSLDPLASTASGTGNTLTLMLALNFTSAFNGVRTEYAVAYDAAGLNGGWQTLGTWTVAGANTAPTTVSVTPASGSGASQTFTFVLADGNGSSDVNNAQILFNSSLTVATGCWLYFVRSSNQVWLRNDEGSAWLGPVTPGTAGSLQNGRCTVSAAGASASGNGNNLTLVLPLTFTPAFAGVRTVYGVVYDAAGLNSGWQQMGTWTVPSAGNTAPTAVSMTPASGSGAARTFSFMLADSNGSADINNVQILFNNGLSVANSCWLYYVRSSDQIWLTNDASSGWLGPISMATGGTLQNVRCSLTLPAASSSASGNNLTLTLPLSFTPSFSGPRLAYALVYDNAGLHSGWVQTGTWTVP